MGLPPAFSNVNLLGSPGDLFSPSTSTDVGAASLDSSPSSSGSGGIGSVLQWAANTGLQYWNAAQKGFTSPVQAPTPVQATPGAVVANLSTQLTGYLPIIIIGVLGLFALKFLTRKK